MEKDIQGSIKELARGALDALVSDGVLEDGLADGDEIALERPQKGEHGDFSTNVAMKVAAGKAPFEVAEMIAEKVRGGLPEEFKKVEAVRPGFVNFFLSEKFFAGLIVEISESGDDFGRGDVGKGVKLIVEHTAVNPNKAMHVGHLRNSVLGDTMVRLSRGLGFDVEVQNYIDDTGVQVADVVLALEEIGGEPAKGESYDFFLWDLNTEINRRMAKDESLKERSREILTKIESGEGEYAEKAAEVAAAISKEHAATVARLNIFYDLFVSERTLIESSIWQETYDKISKLDIVTKETEGKNAGAVVLKYEEKGVELEVPDKILVKSSGELTYTAKDIAYHFWKFGLTEKQLGYSEFFKQANGEPLFVSDLDGEKGDFGKADRVINVIDVRQAYPQKIVKTSLEALGFEKEAAALSHLDYEVVSLSPETAESLGVDVSDGKKSYAMSGRAGIGVKADDMIDLAIEKVRKFREENKKELEVGGDLISDEQIAVGAIRYFLLKFSISHLIVFDIDEVLSLTGDTGPYLQYTHARIKGILRKADAEIGDYEVDALEKEEDELVRKLAEYPDVVGRAFDDLAPNYVCTYLNELAQLFNTFYNKHSVLKAEGDKRAFRLALISASAQVLRNGLEVLGIEAPDRM